jgi:hypothetical protein
MRRRHPGVTSPSLARQCRPRIGGPWQVVLLAVEVRLRTGARIDPGRRLDGGDVPARSTLTGPSPGFRIATVMIRRWPAWVHRRPRWPDGTPARCWIRPAGGCRARSRAASDTRSRRRVSSTAPPSPQGGLARRSVAAWVHGSAMCWRCAPPTAASPQPVPEPRQLAGAPPRTVPAIARSSPALEVPDPLRAQRPLPKSSLPPYGLWAPRRW